MGEHWADVHRRRRQLLLFQSVEASADALAVAALRAALGTGDDVAVAGAALPGHRFFSFAAAATAAVPPASPASSAGASAALAVEVALAGDTTPWNTLALWRLSSLGLLGFPLLADGLLPGVPEAGVEEVSAIAALQTACPARGRALLVRLPNDDPNRHPTTTGGSGTTTTTPPSSSSSAAAAAVSWNTDFDDPARAAWHAQKMASKVTRPAAHLAALLESAGGAQAHHHHHRGGGGGGGAAGAAAVPPSASAPPFVVTHVDFSHWERPHDGGRNGKQRN